MGSGSSKEKENGPSKGGGAKQASVVANEINSPVKVRTDASKSKTVNCTKTGNVNSSPIKVQERFYPKNEEPKTEAKQTTSSKIKKSAEEIEWEGEVDATLELVDNILGKTVKSSVPNHGSTPHHSQQEREKNLRNTKQSQELFPETYAQRHTRENYTIGQDRLIREKTIFRNPKQWAENDDDDENETKKNFDLARFRAANPGTSSRDKEIFTSNEDFETPRYLKESIQRNESPPVETTITPESKLLPAYSKEEEKFMAELMEEEFLGHQTMNYVNMSK